MAYACGTLRMRNVEAISAVQVNEFLAKRAAARQWIERSLGVQLGEDLCKEFRSGIVLCHLCRLIDERSVPVIHEIDSHPFKLKENVFFFLGACEDFGVPKHRLFRVTDLEQNRVVPVVMCIESLADIAVKQLNFVTPFPDMAKLASEVNEGKLSREEVQQLRMQLASLKEATSGRNVPRVASGVLKMKIALLAGGQNKVDFAKYEKGYARFQALYRAHKTRERYFKLVRDVAYRDKVAHELLQTERDYCANLLACTEVYQAVLESKKLVSQEEMQTLFGNIKEVYAANCPLLQSLEDRVAHWYPQQSLGDIMLTIGAFAEAYVKYVVNLAQSIKLSTRLAENDKFSQFVKTCKEDPRVRQLDLQAFLIMPVQRVPRYVLLVQDLFKHTWQEHQDYERLKEALSTIRELGKALNDKKRDAENQATLRELDSQLTGKHCPALLKEGKILVRAGTFTVKKYEIHVVLLSDMVILGKASKKKIKAKNCIPLGQVDFKCGNTNDSGYLMAVLQTGKKKPILCVPVAPADGNAWVADLVAAKQKIAPAPQAAAPAEPKLSAEETLLQKSQEDALCKTTPSGSCAVLSPRVSQRSSSKHFGRSPSPSPSPSQSPPPASSPAPSPRSPRSSVPTQPPAPPTPEPSKPDVEGPSIDNVCPGSLNELGREIFAFDKLKYKPAGVENASLEVCGHSPLRHH
eukprot:TRINITY_DN2182_c0_g1_i1.p1 TRINITY_DN2182_c0_g1~~TRINITY_DN2182_c0_g1_i1.p1  ORF type:complete len:707 (-),score=102.66 TRINITY_DN2182_c0_g1_i1:397-2469(-)